MLRKMAGLTIFLLGLYCTLVEPNWMKLSYREIVVPRLSDPLRILFFSDLQLRKEAGLREKWILKRLENLKFDVVLTTGDMFDKSEGMRPAVDFLTQFASRAPTFGVLGNWEHWSKVDLAEYKSQLESRNVHLLIDENRTFVWKGQTISIVGVNDSSQALHNLPLALKGVPAGSFQILLAHGPVIFPEVAANGIDFMLAGHSHGGQIRIPFLPPLYLPPGCGPYYYGMYRQNKSNMLVTSGVGTSILPIRFACRPEIVMITLHR